MILRVKIKNWKLVCSIRKVSHVVGVISRIKDNEDLHILMWDFDTTYLETVKENLRIVQIRYKLPDIQILESNIKNGNYHAYCFVRKLWPDAVVIVADTKGIDWDFVRLALYRGNFTLRISEKLGNVAPSLRETLQGFSKSDCTPEDLESYVQYEIWNGGVK